MQRAGDGVTRQGMMDGIGAQAGVLMVQMARGIVVRNRTIAAKTAAASGAGKRGRSTACCVGDRGSAADMTSTSSKTRSAAAGAAEMCPATARGADTGATEMTSTTEMRAASDMTATAEMSPASATTAATTAAAMTAATTMSAPASPSCINRAGQRDRQHKN